MSPCGTKQTKWPCSGSPSIPFSFYEAPVSSSLFILPPFQRVSPLFLPRRALYRDREEASHEIFESALASLFLSVYALSVSPCEKAESARPTPPHRCILYLGISNGYALLSRGARTF